MAATRKSYDIKGIAGSGGRFSVGTLVQNQYGAPGIVIRILPVGADKALGPRAWVAYDRKAHVRTWSRTPEARARDLAEASGVCEVRYEYLYMLKPIGQAKRIPKCVIKTRPSALHKQVMGRWVRASKPPRRKTPREKQEEIQQRLQEYDRRARSSRDGFPKYKPGKFVNVATVIDSYERFAYWERQYAKGKHDAIVKYNAKGTLRRQWLAEAHAHERRAARAERIIARLRARSS